MLRNRSKQETAVSSLPIDELVRRSFRAGAFFPLVALGLIALIGLPFLQVRDHTAEAENYAAVLEGILSDRASIFIEKAEGVALLIGRSDESLATTARLEQLVALDASIAAALVTNAQGATVASVTESIDNTPEVVDEKARLWVEGTDNPYVGTPAFDETLRFQAVTMAVAINSPGGEHDGMLQITLKTDWMDVAVGRTNQNLGVNTFLTDGDGVVLVHEDEWRVLARQRIEQIGSGIRRGSDDELVIAGAVLVPGWSQTLVAVSAAPLSIVIPGAAFGLLPLIVIALAFISSRISRQQLVKSVVTPVHDLGTTLGSYGPDNMAIRVAKTEIEEINVVAQAFNATAERMDSLVDSLRSSNARFQALFKDAPVGMALHTIDGAYLDTNRVYEKMFGFSGKEISLSDLMQMVIPESVDAVRNSFAAIARREVDTITFDGGFVSESGKTIWAIVTTTVLPQPGDEMDQVVAQVVDVTELKETQSKLEELLVTKNQFLAAVSHELRTPLTAVIGLAELLRDPESDLDSEQRADLIDTIVESGFDVSNMVEDLLTAARQEAGQLTVVAVPVNMMAQTKQAIEVLNPDAGVTISGQSSTALADPGRVRQILRNLLTNALKYGGDHVTVNLDTSSDFARATVIDDGPGVPPESTELIFHSYERAHAKESHPGSVGIGLSISRELARQMGGDLEYRRHDGRTHFDLMLPLMRDQTESEGVQAEVAVPA